MKILGLDNKRYVLDTRTYLFGQRGEAACKSKIQFACGQLLKQRYPYDIILEECPLPGTKPCLYLDFLLPARKLAVEIQGRQHDEFVPFFHGNREGFAKAQNNDTMKKRWCDLNDISLYLVYSEEEMKAILGI